MNRKFKIELEVEDTENSDCSAHKSAVAMKKLIEEVVNDFMEVTKIEVTCA